MSSSEAIYDFLECYRQETDRVELTLGEPMRRHTSFHIGGSADIFAEPADEEALEIGTVLCRRFEIPYLILGNGSNLLVGDRGIRGAVFSMAGLSECARNGAEITAGAGIPLMKLSRLAADASLTGLEFAGGIPGSLGGAVFMNAGAYGGEMKAAVRGVRVLTESGIRSFRGDEMDFSYRHSRIEAEGGVILSAVLSLAEGDPEKIRETMKDLQKRRQDKQPLEYFSAGSTFKRPEGFFAGKLIEDAGLKGFSVGAAQVSEKHAGFVINRGGASAREVRQLMEEVQRRVFERFGVTLEPEVRMVGEF